MAGPSLDASRVQFCVGNNSKFSELLYAIPMIRGTPVQGNVLSSSSTELLVQVQSASSVPSAAFYDLSSASVAAVTANVNAPVQFNVGRLGARVVVLAIDQRSTASGSAQDFAYLQTQVAMASVMRQLSSALATGTVASGSFAGFADFLSTYTSRVTPTSGSLINDVTRLLRSVHPSGPTLSGEGPHCLIAGPRVREQLMLTSAGQSGTSGYRTDPRTGMLVYHFLGMPVYVTDTGEPTVAPFVGNLYAANLGPTGLQLIHAYGSAESFGIVAEETPVPTATGRREITVHGAWSLVLWEPEGWAAVTGIPIASS